MPPVGFETTISGGQRPKTYALDRAATGTCQNIYYIMWNFSRTQMLYYSEIYTHILCMICFPACIFRFIPSLNIAHVTKVQL